MKLMELGKQYMPYFRGFDLFGMMDREKSAPDYMLGAVSDKEEGAVPAGLLLGQSKKKELQLRWLFVDPLLRGKSYGELLLSKAFQHASETGAEKLRVLFPKEYGYESICKNDHIFLRKHGFRQLENGDMEASLSDYARLTEEYQGPSFEDESDMLDKLLSLEVEDEEDAVSEYDREEYFAQIHKPWTVRNVGLREFSMRPALQKFIKRTLDGTKALKVGSIGELTYEQFRDGVELCEKKEHTGFLKHLLDVPVDYFDLDVSSYIMTEERVSGLCLVHFNRKAETVITELLFTSEGDSVRSIAELLRFTLLAANGKYPAGTTILLPNDEERHRQLVKKLFGE